jgi:hypothetical protein
MYVHVCLRHDIIVIVVLNVGILDNIDRYTIDANMCGENQGPVVCVYVCVFYIQIINQPIEN